MKKILYSALSAMLFMMASCSKKLEVKAPTLTINVNTTKTYHTTDTVTFNFSGYADNVAVWTGDSTHNYAYRNRITDSVGNVMMTFNSQNQQDIVMGLQLLAATNIKLNHTTGLLDSTAVVNTTWTDITSRINFSTPTITATNYVCPPFNIADLISKPTDSLYLAFKYTSPARVTGNKSQQWIINGLSITNVLPSHQSIPLVSSIAGLKFLSVSNPPLPLMPAPTTKPQTWGTSTTVNGGVISGTFFTTTSNLDLPAAPVPNNANSAWAVTNALVLNSVSPDYSVPIKFVGSILPKSFTYKFPYPGKFVVTFLIQNDTADDNKSEIKQFTINVASATTP